MSRPPTARSFEGPYVKGDLGVHDGVMFKRLPVGSNNGGDGQGEVLESNSAATNGQGVRWTKKTPLTTKGDLLVMSGIPAPLPLGDEGDVIRVRAADLAFGLQWEAPVGCPLGFSGAGAVVGAGLTRYLGIGTGNVGSTEANQEFYVSSSATIRRLRVYVSGNATGANGNTITVRKNGVSQSLAVSYDSGETGAKADTDSGHAFTVVPGDRLAIQVVNAGSGDLTVESVSLEIF